MTLANEVAGVSSEDVRNTLTTQIDKVNQNQTARNVGQLYATVQTANNQANAAVNQANTVATQAEVAESLRSKGISLQKVDGIAEAVTARLNHQELTRTQKNILSHALNSSAVRNTISELMKKKAGGIDSTLKNAYDEINTIGGNKNGRETALWNLQNQRADGRLQSLQAQTRAEDGNGSGVPGTLRENKGLPHATLPSARRGGLTSDLDAFSDSDYATVTEGSALHQVQNTFRQEYGIECLVIKDSSWTRSSPAYSRNGVVYIREGIDLVTLSTAIPHEATHVMKQQSFRPYVDFISRTPDLLNFQSSTIEGLLDVVAEHKNINPFTANDQQLFNFYDELNSIVYGLYKSGVLDTKGYDLGETIPGAFNDFASYIQEMDRIHEEFRNRNATTGAKETDGGLDALMDLANEVAGVSSEDVRNTLTTQIDKVNQNPTARNVGQLYATVQTANNQANAAVNQANTVATQAEVAESLKGKGIPSWKIDSLASAIVARVNGQELTRTQRDVLRFELGRPSVQKVINELIQKKSQGIDSVQKSVYDESNLSSLKKGEETALRNSSSLEVLSTAQQRGRTSETAALGDTSVAEDSPIHQERNAPPKRRSRGGKDAKKPYSTSRPSYGKGQIEQVWENAKDPITGKVYDPSGVEITWDPTKPRNGQWDMGHIPDAKYSVMHQLYMDDLMSLKDFLEWYRNPANYRPELPSTNRSHKYE